MRSTFRTVAALVAGAAAMYYFDPKLGRRRRARMQDQMAAGSHDVSDYVHAKSQYLTDRMRGMAARESAPSPGSTADIQMHERIRAKLGHMVAAPGAIDVEVVDDYVCLRGHILASEVQAVVAEIRAMPGVERLDNELSVHETADNVPELQGVRRDRA